MKNKQQLGAAKRRLRKSLAEKGIKNDVIDAAIAATFKSQDQELKKVPKAVTTQMLVAFNKGGKGTAVSVVWCKSGRFRTYAAESYNKIVAHGRKLGEASRGKKRK